MTFKYKFNEIRCDRKTVGITISPNNEITVRCPWGLSDDALYKFLNSKIGWIEKVLYKNAGYLVANEEILNYEKVLIGGKVYPLKIGENNSFDGKTVKIKDVPHLKKLFIDCFSKEFEARVYEFAEKTKLYPSEIKFNYFKSRWACCDVKNQLVFNYLTLMLPIELQNYIIVHELCHVLCKNHSQAFWRLVGEFVPDYKSLKKGLDKYAFLIDVYS